MKINAEFALFTWSFYLQCRKQIFHILARHLSFAAFRFLNLVILRINHIIYPASEEIYVDQSNVVYLLVILMSTLIFYFAVPTKEQLGSSSKVSLLLTLSLNDQPKCRPDFANNANHKQIKMQKNSSFQLFQI